jgi:hypothetical protein
VVAFIANRRRWVVGWPTWVVGAVLVLGLLARVAWRTSPVVATVRQHAAIEPVRDPSGSLARALGHQLISANWPGYAEATYQTAMYYMSATGKWVVPAVQAVPRFSRTYSSAWVGIGGDCEDSTCSHVDSSLIQLGTESDVLPSGLGSYYVWYELLPQAAIRTSLTIHAGDKVAASLQMISQTRTYQTWALSMTNQTTGQSWSRTVTYNSSFLSAEWIAEAPSSGAILPLANFHTVTFDPGTINGGANPKLVAGDSILLQDPSGMSANPSTPDAEGDGFNTCWGATATPTACSPPSS